MVSVNVWLSGCSFFKLTFRCELVGSQMCPLSFEKISVFQDLLGLHIAPHLALPKNFVVGPRFFGGEPAEPPVVIKEAPT